MHANVAVRRTNEGGVAIVVKYFTLNWKYDELVLCFQISFTVSPILQVLLATMQSTTGTYTEVHIAPL